MCRKNLLQLEILRWALTLDSTQEGPRDLRKTIGIKMLRTLLIETKKLLLFDLNTFYL